MNNTSPEYTKGEQLWDYLFSEDVAKALFLLAVKGKNNETYCVANGNHEMLKDYIVQIKNAINKDIELKLGVIPYNEKQVMNLNVDVTKIKEQIGFVPENTFEEGIKKTIEWYKERGSKDEKN